MQAVLAIENLCRTSRRVDCWHVLTLCARIISQEARLAEIEANRKPVYEDKPIIARGWESETADETAREVKTSGYDPLYPTARFSLVRF